MMSKHGKLRENKRCESCGHYVEGRFCPECGQENIETRQPFHYLFTISIEDFVHYDGRFWKTIQYLLFRPAQLTKVYLSGKRNHYVPPVTLYIFISFITFFVPSLLPDKNGNMKDSVNVNVTEDNKKKALVNINLTGDNKDDDKFDKAVEKFNKEKLEERLKHDFPKAIFLYMPVFAFWLWVFHNKKKWYYFDHGIFTLHYFSFILLGILLYIVLNWAFSFFDTGKIGLIKTASDFFSIAYFSYFIYYFFHSHRLIYGETKAASRLKCSLLFFINSFCIILFLLSYLFLELYITDKSFFALIIEEIKH